MENLGKGELKVDSECVQEYAQLLALRKDPSCKEQAEKVAEKVNFHMHAYMRTDAQTNTQERHMIYFVHVFQANSHT